MCLDLLKEGILCKPTHKTKIRFTPPLVMTSEHIQEIAQKFEKIVRKY
jgi:ornithine--oxo-acid transaminase